MDTLKGKIYFRCQGRSYQQKHGFTVQLWVLQRSTGLNVGSFCANSPRHPSSYQGFFRTNNWIFQFLLLFDVMILLILIFSFS